MSVLSVRIPCSWELSTFNNVMNKAADIDFEFLTFKKTGKVLKNAFIKISEKVDPQFVIERLEKRILKETGKPIQAWIVDEMPDVQVEVKRLKFNKRSKNEEDQIRLSVSNAHRELMTELQHKYNRLFKLSRVKTDHKLLLDLSRQIFGRLRVIVAENPHVSRKPFTLTGAYRREHTHAGDFKFILAALHKIEDAEEKPRSKLTKADLIQPVKHLTIGNVPYRTVVDACNKYTDKIVQKAQEHVDNLKTETIDGISPAKQRVRRELKKLSPYLPMIIRQVMSKHLVPRNVLLRRVRVYGEPFLPGQEVMRRVLEPYHPQNVQRVQSMFNLLRFHVAAAHYAPLMELDNTTAAGGSCRLVVRSNEGLAFYTTPDDVKAELMETL